MDTDISDAGLENLQGLANLADLNLAGCKRVTDAGLALLEGLKNLKTLTLRGNAVTPEGLKKVQKALPNCRLVTTGASAAAAVRSSADERRPPSGWLTSRPGRSCPRNNAWPRRNPAPDRPARGTRRRGPPARSCSSSNATAHTTDTRASRRRESTPQTPGRNRHKRIRKWAWRKGEGGRGKARAGCLRETRIEFPDSKTFQPTREVEADRQATKLRKRKRIAPPP